MKNMFALCSLKSIILSNFKTNKVSDMSHMFYGCDKLNQLNLLKVIDSIHVQSKNNLENDLIW